nr:uncharacterized protein LOC114924999 [Arachis hypogaea]
MRNPKPPPLSSAPSPSSQVYRLTLSPSASPRHTHTLRTPHSFSPHPFCHTPTPRERSCTTPSPPRHHRGHYCRRRGRRRRCSRRKEEPRKSQGRREPLLRRLHCHRTPSSAEREPDTARKKPLVALTVTVVGPVNRCCDLCERKKPATILVAVSAVGCRRHPRELPPRLTKPPLEEERSPVLPLPLGSVSCRSSLPPETNIRAAQETTIRTTTVLLPALFGDC